MSIRTVARPILKLYSNRGLILQLASRDVAQRYKNSALGAFWVIGQPLIQLALYTFVFQVAFKARWGTNVVGSKNAPFGLILFVGLIMHTLLGEAIIRGPELVTSNHSFVKRVIFPLEILPIVNTISALVNLAFGFAILIVGVLFVADGLPISAFLVVIPIGLLAAFSLGVCWLFAAFGVYFPDLKQFSPPLITILLFTAPICYPAEIVPAQFRWLLDMNPLTIPVESARAMLFGGAYLWESLLVYGLVACASAMVGYVLFMKLRPGFADAL